MTATRKIIESGVSKAIRWTLLFAIAWPIWKIAPVYAAALRFKFAVSEVCKTGATARLAPHEIRDDILFKAKQLDLPIRQRNIEVRIQHPHVSAVVKYEVPIELGPRQIVLNFHAAAEEMPLVNVVGGEEHLPNL